MEEELGEKTAIDVIPAGLQHLQQIADSGETSREGRSQAAFPFLMIAKLWNSRRYKLLTVRLAP